MTPEEAIQQLEFDRAMILFDSLTGEEITPEMLKLINKENYLTYVADGIAIEALKEVQQYRKIGTVDECRKLVSIVNKAERDELAKIIDEWLKYSKIGTAEECRAAVEKQKLKNPVKDKYHHNCCPNCGWIVSGEGGYGEEFCPHCENCGQAIQWENLKGMEDENT